MNTKEEALKLADELEKPVPVPNRPDMIYIDGHRMYGAQIIRRLVEELDKKQQGLVEASAMLVNYKYELDLERTMSAQLKEELEKQK